MELAKQRLVDELIRAGRKSSEYQGVRATLMKQSEYRFDEPGLKKALGARVWNKLTVAKLDKKKLEAAMANGDVDPVVVAAYAAEKESAPYIRLTENPKDEGRG